MVVRRVRMAECGGDGRGIRGGGKKRIQKLGLQEGF